MSFYLTFFLLSLFTISWISSASTIAETRKETKLKNENHTNLESETGNNKNETSTIPKMETKLTNGNSPSNLETSHKNKTTAQKSNTKIEVSDRINLNFGSANSYAEDEDGQFGGSHSNSFGINVGIKNNNTGAYTSLTNGAGGSSTSFSSGDDSPPTWAETNSTAGDTSATGTAKAGFSGGKGTSDADNYSDTEKIDLGNGETLFSNLHNVTKTTTTTTANPLQIKLIFH